MNKTTLSKLDSLRSRMTKAYESEEWQYLAKLDKECQRTVTEIIADDPKAMFEELREMLGFYSKLVESCKQQRDSYADEVRQFRQARDRTNAYAANISSIN